MAGSHIPFVPRRVFCGSIPLAGQYIVLYVIQFPPMCVRRILRNGQSIFFRFCFPPYHHRVHHRFGEPNSYLFHGVLPRGDIGKGATIRGQHVWFCVECFFEGTQCAFPFHRFPTGMLYCVVVRFLFNSPMFSPRFSTCAKRFFAMPMMFFRLFVENRYLGVEPFFR